MPWTFAHPAAVLPLRRWCGASGLSFAGLVAGSISPDLLYYVGRFDLGRHTHTPLGILLLCVPLGWLALTAARAMREPVARLLPEPHRSALLAISDEAAPSCSRDGRLAATLRLVASLALGAATHVVWDAFTHDHRFFVEQWPVLRTPLFPLLGGEVRVFGVLQYASSVLGVAALAIAYARWLRRGRAGPATASAARPDGIDPSDRVAERRRYIRLGWLALLSIGGAVSLVAIESALGVIDATASRAVVRSVTYAGTWFFALLVAVAWWSGRRARTPASSN